MQLKWFTEFVNKRTFEIWKPDPVNAQRGQILYLRRITLLEFAGRRLCLHLIYRSDEDPDPHDHPWNFYTCALRHPYTDEQWSWDGVTRTGPVYERMRRFRPILRKAEHLHRVIIDPHQASPSISLVFLCKLRRRWNFCTATGPVYWRTYLGIPADEATGPRARED